MKARTRTAAKPDSRARTGMSRTKKPWSEKLRPEMKPEVVKDRKAGALLLLPTPMGLAAEIAAVPKGTVCTMSELRDRMARKHGAARACPLMTGIFFNIVAGAAEDQLAAGEEPLAPYWRIVRDNRSLSPKTPMGPARQAEHLRAEGIRVDRESFVVAADC